MNEKELIKGIFHPDTDDENARCWSEMLPFISDGEKLSPQVKKRVVDVIGRTLKNVLDYMKLGNERAYYCYYQAALWEYLRKQAFNYHNPITDLAGFNFFLYYYVNSFALDERKADFKTIKKEIDFDSIKNLKVSKSDDDRESDDYDDSDDEFSDDLLEIIEGYVDNLNTNEVMAQYLKIISSRIEKEAERHPQSNASKKQTQDFIEDLDAIYVRGLSLEERAEEKGFTNVKSMGPRIKRAKGFLMKYILPEIRKASANHFIWLRKQSEFSIDEFFTAKEMNLLELFFVEQMDLNGISIRLKTKPSDVREILFAVLRKYYKVRTKLYQEHKSRMRENKSYANIDIYEFEKSLINKK